MKTLLIALALAVAVISGTVAISTTSSAPAHAGTCSDGNPGC
jgi:hypothetical protein